MDQGRYTPPQLLNLMQQQEQLGSDQFEFEFGQNNRFFPMEQVYACTDDSEEEYRNLESLPPGPLKGLVLKEILDNKSFQHMPSLSRGNLPDICNFNMSYHPVDCHKVPSNEFQNFSSSLRDTAMSKGFFTNGYRQRAVSGIIACDGKMQGVQHVASSINTFHGRTSAISASSYMNKFSEIEQIEDGSYLHWSNAQQVSKTSAGNHIKLQRNDRGSVKNNQNVGHMTPKVMVPQNFSQNTSEACKDTSRLVSSTPISISSYAGSNSQLLIPGSQQTDRSLQQNFLQVDGSLHSQSHFFSEKQNESYNQITEQDSDKLTKLHAELNGIQPLHLETSVLGFGPINAPRLTNSSSPDMQTILCSYIMYKSTYGDTANQASFLDHIHMTKCNSQKCNCHQYYVLITHYDNCLNSNCSICAPFRMDSATGISCIESKRLINNLWGTSCNRESYGPCSDTVVDSQPPLKRHKMDASLLDTGSPAVNQPCPPNRVLHVEQHKAALCSSINVMEGNKKVSSPMKDQPGDTIKRCYAIDQTLAGDTCNTPQFEQLHDQLPHLEQWNEAVSFSGAVTEVSKDQLNFQKDQKVESLSRCDNPDSDINGDLHSTFRLLENLMSWVDHGDIDDTCNSDITNGIIDTYQGLMYSEVPDGSVVSTRGNKEDPEDKYLSMTELEKKVNILASAADSKALMELKQLKIQGVTWADYFSVEEMNEHLQSLHQIDQGTGDNMKNSYGENVCQLCTMDTLELAPVQLYCSSCGILIKRNLIFYRTSDETALQHCFCSSCYRKPSGSTISFHGSEILKSKLKKEKNNEKIYEPWVQCDKCERWQHQICALYNLKSDPGGKAEYICPKCWLEEVETGQRKPLVRTVRFRAKDLPTTMLSDHIERRLFKRLREEREVWARDSQKELNEYQVPGEADLTVRVVLSVDKTLEVKRQFLDIINDSDYPAQFLYRSKVILLFQKLEGVDVCLFAMYVQEYGSECGKPNQRCVYISYLDSVKYLRPERKTTTGEALRTLVYHEILIGYLDYCKKRGFSTCYIWACPPFKGEDFILNCHPENQRRPTVDKLRNWYGSMIKRASKENVVVDYTKFYDCFFLDSKITLSQLPYFDGDYWSNAAGMIIKDLELENGRRLQCKGKKQMTKRSLKAMGHDTLSSEATKAVLVMQKLMHDILPAKDDFLIVHLQYFCKCCHDVILSGVRWSCSKCTNFHICSRCLNTEQNPNEEKTHTSKKGEKHVLDKVVIDDVPPSTDDGDIVLDNDLFSDRHAFLNFCQSNHYQFDSLRRAKHSSVIILYYLHKSFNPVVDQCTEL